MIEATIAAALLAVGVAGIISSWSTTMAVLAHQRRFADATNLTRAYVEKLLMYPAGHAALNPGVSVQPPVDGFGIPASGNSSYTVSYEIVANRPAAGFIELIVTTRWIEGAGLQRSTSFNTFRER